MALCTLVHVLWLCINTGYTHFYLAGDCKLGTGKKFPNLTVLGGDSDPVGMVQTPGHSECFLYMQQAGLRMTDFMQNSLTRRLILPGGKFFIQSVYSFLYSFSSVFLH